MHQVQVLGLAHDLVTLLLKLHNYPMSINILFLPVLGCHLACSGLSNQCSDVLCAESLLKGIVLACSLERERESRESRERENDSTSMFQVCNRPIG